MPFALMALVHALAAADIEDAAVLLESQNMALHLTERERGNLISELVMAMRTTSDATASDAAAADMLPLCTISILTNQSPVWRKLSLHGLDLLIDQDGRRYRFRYGNVVLDAIQRKTIDTHDWTPIK